MKNSRNIFASLATLALCSLQVSFASPLKKVLYKKTLSGYFGAGSLTQSEKAGQPVRYIKIEFESGSPFSDSKWSILEKYHPVFKGTLEYSIDQKTGDLTLSFRAEKPKGLFVKETEVLRLVKPGFNVASLKEGLLFVLPIPKKMQKYLREITDVIEEAKQKNLPYIAFMTFQSQLSRPETIGIVEKTDPEFFNKYGGIEYVYLHE